MKEKKSQRLPAEEGYYLSEYGEVVYVEYDTKKKKWFVWGLEIPKRIAENKNHPEYRFYQDLKFGKVYSFCKYYFRFVDDTRYIKLDDEFMKMFEKKDQEIK